MTVAVDGAERYVMQVSTGRPGYDTPNGTFKPNRMDADHLSQEWDNAPMPHSIFFDMNGHAIHGFFDVKHLGSPVSEQRRGVGSRQTAAGAATAGARERVSPRANGSVVQSMRRYRSSRRRGITLGKTRARSSSTTATAWSSGSDERRAARGPVQ